MKNEPFKIEEHVPTDAEKQAALAEFVNAIKTAETEGRAAAAEARAAMRRLAKAAYGHDNSQATIITRCLASIYNGGDALPVQLDDIRRLDWTLQKDLVAVIVGVGQKGCPDYEIRIAFVEVAGGEAGAEWLHWWTTGGPHVAALKRLVGFIRESRGSSSARALLAMLQSIVRGEKCDLSRLGYIDDEHTRDFVRVMSGLFGREQGVLYVETVQNVLEEAGLS